MLMLHRLERAAFVLRFVVLVAALVPASLQAATFTGEFFNTNSRTANLNQALNVIANSSPTATFQSTAIDYPSGNTDRVSSRTTLATFLGADAASIIGNGLATIETSIIRLTGFIDLLPGIQTFTVGSDDGFRLTINDEQISQRDTPRPFRTTTVDANPGVGRVSFELLFYENFGNTGLEVFVDNTIVTPAPIPLPAGFSLIVTALAALGLLKWRRRRVFPLVNPA